MYCKRNGIMADSLYSEQAAPWNFSCNSGRMVRVLLVDKLMKNTQTRLPVDCRCYTIKHSVRLLCSWTFRGWTFIFREKKCFHFGDSFFFFFFFFFFILRYTFKKSINSAILHLKKCLNIKFVVLPGLFSYLFLVFESFIWTGVSAWGSRKTSPRLNFSVVYAF